MKDLDLRLLSLDTRGEIESVVGRFPPYCDFNFASLFVWDVDEDTRFARVGSSLVLELCDNRDRALLYTFIGTENVADLADALIDRSIADGYGDRLRVVPEEIAEVLSRDPRFSVTPDPDNDDYVMSTERLATGLTGSRRAELVRFESAFPTATFECLSFSSARDRERLLALFETWALATKKPDPLAVVEDRKAYARAIANADALGFEAFGVSIDGGALVACGIVEVRKPSGYAVSHFQKFDRSAPGVSAFLNRGVGRALHERGVPFVNFEQDLGVPGLRDAKRSYGPVRYLRKFDVRRARHSSPSGSNVR